MKKLTFTQLSVAVTATLTMGLLTACGGGSTPSATESPASPVAVSPSPAASPGAPVASPAASPAGTLAVEKTTLAKKGADGKLEPTTDKTFKRGDTVYLVLLNVGKFKKGEDGKHRLEMDVEVTDPQGTVLLSQKDLLKESGHVELEGDVATSPYGNIDTKPDTKAGDYVMKVTIYDKVGGGKVTQSANFTLE